MTIICDAPANGLFNGGGASGFDAYKAINTGNVYTWTWNDVPMPDETQSIVVHCPTSGNQIHYLGAAASGSAITGTKIIDATAASVNGPHHNVHFLEAGAYDVTPGRLD